MLIVGHLCDLGMVRAMRLVVEVPDDVVDATDGGRREHCERGRGEVDAPLGAALADIFHRGGDGVSFIYKEHNWFSIRVGT